VSTAVAPSPIRAWWLALRPATLTAAVGPVAVGTALAARDGRANLVAASAALIGATLLQIGTNLYNDHADHVRGADTEARLGPPRAVQRGWLSSAQILWGAGLSFALAAVAGLYLVATAGWPIVVIGLLGIACGILYTGGPAPLAYVGLGDVFVLAFFGVAAVCGTYFAQAGTVSPAAVASSLAVGSLATAILVVNNLRDRHTDAAAGKRTLVVRLGARFGRLEHAGLLAVAYAISAALAITSGEIAWLAPWLSAPLAVGAIRRVAQRDGADLNPELGATARLGLLFSLLLAAGALLGRAA
jgi:1,4-dihydroxy-2-naphthoate polyprenyltransferase